MPNLIVTGEYSTKKFECSYFKPHGVPLKSAALEAKIQNMCAECECAKFADNAIKPSEMWKLHTMLKDKK